MSGGVGSVGAVWNFSEHRDYEPGDDLRFVDWNVFARLDRLVTKVFIEEEDLTVALLLDASASMDWGNPNKFLFARRMALCLGVVALRAGHRLRVHGLGGSCPPDLAGLRGGSRSLPLSRWLLDARADGGSDLAETVGRVSGGRQGRGVLILLSDCLEEGAADAVRRAASSGWETWVLRTGSPAARLSRGIGSWSERSCGGPSSGRRGARRRGGDHRQPEFAAGVSHQIECRSIPA